MPSLMDTIRINTDQRNQLIDISDAISKVIKASGVNNGTCYIYVPHTTAAITINENADRTVLTDILQVLSRLVPRDSKYQHREGNSDAHIKASIMGSSVTVFVKNASLVLGTWQGIFFCEFDGPRQRQVLYKIVEDL